MDTNPFNPGCSCLFEDACSAGGTRCECEANDNSRWLADGGDFAQKELLPLKVAEIGDTGGSTERFKMKVGPLTCTHGTTGLSCSALCSFDVLACAYGSAELLVQSLQ